MTQVIEGQLEIDTNRGVIYFHGSDGRTRLRICRLPLQSGKSPLHTLEGAEFIDITAPDRVSYTADPKKESPEEKQARYLRENAESHVWYLGCPLGGNAKDAD